MPFRFFARHLLVAAGLTSLLLAQAAPPIEPEGSPLRAAQEALARGDRAAAARALAAVPLPPPDDPRHDAAAAKWALLDAGAAPWPERARRLLAVAAAFPDRDEGLTAVVAALGLIDRFLSGGREELAKETPEPPEGRTPPDDDAAAVVMDCAPLVERWRTARPEDPRSRLAAILLERCRAGPADEHLEYLRVAPGTPIPVPQPVAENLTVRLHGLDSPATRLDAIRDGAPPRPPLFEGKIDRATASLPAPPPGLHVFELRSDHAGWRRFQRIVVSGLDLAAHAVPGGVLALATLDGRPASGVRVTLRPDWDGPPGPGVLTDASGIARVGTPPGVGRFDKWIVAAEADGGHRAWVRVGLPSRDTARPELTAHVVVDRPLYRPGDVVRGRIVVRRHNPRPLDTLFGPVAVRPSSAPLAGHALALRVGFDCGIRRRIALTTDAHGVATFEIPLRLSDPPGTLRLTAWLPAAAGGPWEGIATDQDLGPHVPLLDESPAEIREFRRPPLLLDVTGPEHWAPGSPDPEILVAAHHPSGAPAAGGRGRARARIRSFDHEAPFELDGEGRACVRLRLGDLDLQDRAWDSGWSVHVVAPDGQEVSEGRSLVIGMPAGERRPPATEPVRARKTLSLTGPDLRVRAGDEASFDLEGPAGAAVLVTAGRDGAFAARSVVLDASGRGRVSFPTRLEWLPRIKVRATPARAPAGEEDTSSWRWNPEAALDLADPAERIEVAIEKDRETYGPGAAATWRILTRDGLGRPAPATVALSVVDESLFLLAPDRTRDPLDALRPEWRLLLLEAALADPPASPWLVVGRLLAGGRARGWLNCLWSMGGAAGGGAPGGTTGSGAGGSARTDFRATAFFAPAIATGEDGRAAVRFAFPDDLTTWRITAIACGPGVQAGKLVTSVRTTKAASVEPLLPRVLRAGDRLRLVTRVAGDGDGPLPARVTFDANEAWTLEDGAAGVEVPAGGSATVATWVDARRSGAADLGASLRRAGDDAALDAVRRTIPVLPRETLRPATAAALVEGPATLGPPDVPGARRAGFQVEVLASADAVLRAAAGFLTEYPHGCAEQTASRLVPVVLAAHARSGLQGILGGAPKPDGSLAPEQAHRLEVGLARLRDLQHPDGGFSWWHRGQDSDLAVSANVFRFLALMHEAGMDPAAYGIRLAPDLVILAQAAASCVDSGTVVSIPSRVFPRDAIASLGAPTQGAADARGAALAAVELASAGLLLFPDEARLKDAAARAAGALGLLPTGLAARLGRALALSGDTAAAAAVFDALERRLGETGAPAGGAGFDESPAAQAAAVLDLVNAVRPESSLRARLVAELLRRQRGGRIDHTAGTAAALLALARDRARRPASAREGPAVVRIEADGFDREITIGPADGDRAVVELPPDARSVRITPVSGSTIIATATASFAEDGATAEARAAPIQVARTLWSHARRSDGTSERLAVAGPVARGARIEAEIDVSAPPGTSHLLLECPVPAGCEVIDGPGLVVRDDRASVGLPALDAAGHATVRLGFVAGMEGRFVFPPATVEAMYRAELWGRSAGGTIEVGPEPPPSASAGEAALLGRNELRARYEILRDAIVGAQDEDARVQAIDRLADLPYRIAMSWLREEAPFELRASILVPEVAAAWVRALGPEAAARFRSPELDRLVGTLGVPARDAVRALGPVLAAAGFAGDRADDFFLSLGSMTERRLLGLVLARSGRIPPELPPLKRLELADALIAGDPALQDPEVRAERTSALADGVRAAWWKDDAPAKSVLVRPFSDSVRALWTRDGIGVGPEVPPETLQRLAAFLDHVVDLWLAAGRSERALLAPALIELLGPRTWPDTGSAEPEEHKALARHAALQRARAAEVALADLEAGGLDGDGAAGLWKLATEGRDPGDRIPLVRRGLALLERAKPAADGSDDVEDPGWAVLAAGMDLDGAPELRFPALALVASGPESWRPGAWRLLSDADRRAFPLSRLLDFACASEGGRWAAEEIMDRGPEAKARLVGLADRIEDAFALLPVAGKSDGAALAAAPLDAVLALFRASDFDSDQDVALRERLVDHLVARPEPTAALAARLGRPGDLRVRQALLRAVALRGGAEIPRDPTDPAHERWATLLAARTGDPPAADRVRSWLADASMPREEKRELFWCLEPQATVRDLVALHDDFDDAVVPRVLDRAAPEQIVALWTAPGDDRRRERGLLWKLPPAAAGRVLDAAFAAWRQGVNTWPVLDRAGPEDALRVLLPPAPELPARQAEDLLESFADEPAVALPLARRLLEHEAAPVREAAARVLHDVTGEPCAYRDGNGNPVIVGPTTAAGRRSDHLKRLRSGLGAAAAALASALPDEVAAAAEALALAGL